MRTLIALLLLLPIITGCATPSQIMLDAEVKRLCAIDGGIKVYETVRLPAERFDKYGNMRIPFKEYAKSTDEYILETEVQYLKQGNPEMWRDHAKVIRRSDGKVLGEEISYARRGGDIPGPWHDSSFRCPSPSKYLSIESAIFLKGDK